MFSSATFAQQFQVLRPILDGSSFPKKASFPSETLGNSGSAFCLHFDLTDQFECALLLLARRGGDLEGGCIASTFWGSARVAHDGFKLARQGLETVCRRAVIQGVAEHLLH